MTVELDRDIESRLQALVRTRGIDRDGFITAAIRAAIEEAEGDDLPRLTDAEAASARAGVERGLADVASGRTISVEEAITRHNEARRLRGTLP
jgi:predicted transcriptional regulator